MYEVSPVDSAPLVTPGIVMVSTFDAPTGSASVTVTGEAGSDVVAMGSEKAIANWSVACISPARVPGLEVAIPTGTGPALSAGAVAANDERLPAASRTPFVVAASATVKEPTAVLAAP